MGKFKITQWKRVYNEAFLPRYKSSKLYGLNKKMLEFDFNTFSRNNSLELFLTHPKREKKFEVAKDLKLNELDCTQIS